MACLNGSSVVLLITMTLFLLTMTPTCGALKTRQVRVTSELEGGKPLTVHCKSKDDDLGVHVLQPKGSYEFSFKPNFFTTSTLFFCSFEWPGAFHWFDIYVDARDNKICSKCHWVVYEDGPCMYNWSDQQYNICHTWN